MIVKIVPYKKEHVELMNLRDHEHVLLHDPNMLGILEGSIAVTAVADGVIVCCYGINPYLDGVADIWLLPSIYVEEKHGMAVARGAREFLANMKEDLGLRRMETTCLADDLHDRWMTFLGFEKEGTKKQYYGGKDYHVWGKLWE